MTIEQLRNLIADSRKKGETNKVAAFQAALSAIQAAQGRIAGEFSEEKILTIINREVSIFQEEIDYLKTAGKDWVDLELRRLALEELLPVKIPENQYADIVADAFEEINPTSIRDIGRILGKISEKYGMSIHKGRISVIVKEKISKL